MIKPGPWSRRYIFFRDQASDTVHRKLSGRRLGAGSRLHRGGAGLEPRVRWALLSSSPVRDAPGPTLRPPLAERKADVTPSPSLTVEPCTSPLWEGEASCYSPQLRVSPATWERLAALWTATFPGHTCSQVTQERPQERQWWPSGP